MLTPGETEELFGWLRHFVADGGTVVLVTHKLQGGVVDCRRRHRAAPGCARAHGTGGRARGRRPLVRSLTGEDSHGQPLRTRVPTAARGSSVVRLVDACARDARGVVRVQSATIECFAGEIVGIAGIEGSGVHELLRLLAGRLTPSAGSVVLPSTIGFVPEDRQRDALIEEFSLTENFCLRSAATRTGRIRGRRLRNRPAW